MKGIMKRSNREYFANRNCDICKRSATMYRYSSKMKKGFMLCDDPECQFKNLVIIGYINIIERIK